MLVIVTRLHLLHLVVYFTLHFPYCPQASNWYLLATLAVHIYIYRVCNATSRICNLFTSFVLCGHLTTISIAFVVALHVIRSYAFEVEQSIVDYICVCMKALHETTSLQVVTVTSSLRGLRTC